MKRRNRHDAESNSTKQLTGHNGNESEPNGAMHKIDSNVMRNNSPKNRLGHRLLSIAAIFIWIVTLRYHYSLLDTTEGVKGKIQQTGMQLPLRNDGVLISPSSRGYDSIFCRPTETARANQRTNSIDFDKPVFLWGIPSTKSDYESKRRRLLRKTYLSFDKSLQDLARIDWNATRTNEFNPINSNRICSFQEWTCNEDIRNDCQMIFVFFIGAHKNDSRSFPPILVNESITDFRDMLVPYDSPDATKLDVREPGTVYFNIRENQFDGKMTTWFKFASLVAKEYNSGTLLSRPIDYVFKVDSDLLLLTPNFFSWFDRVHKDQQKSELMSRDNGYFQSDEGIHQVYGGVEFPDTNCAINYTFDHPCPLPLSGPSYMSGELNFCSLDLAAYITSDDCPRDLWTIPHEDVSLSNYVYSYSNNSAYHRRIGFQDDKNDSLNRTIRVVSVNTSRILLLPNMRADWYPVNLKKNPEVLTSGELLWGHSIKRGKHNQYLYWKKDSKFSFFWNRFLQAYANIYYGRKNTTIKEPSTVTKPVEKNHNKHHLVDKMKKIANEKRKEKKRKEKKRKKY